MTESRVVYLNGHVLDWREGLSLADVVARQERAPQAVATAVNGQFVARGLRADTLLRPGDQVTLFQAIVGG